MRGALLVVGLLVLGLIAALFYRDLQTRSLVTQALQRTDKTEVELSTLRASVRVLSAQVEGRILPARKTRITSYLQDAQLAGKLKGYGFDVSLARARPPGKPDAVFIGAFVAAEEAQLVLSLLPYEVDYLFRVDYPKQLGGDPEGRTIGIGYFSGQPGNAGDPRARPARISRQQLASLMQPKLPNTEFQARLRQISGSGR
jgi:hypothetical protein